MRNVWLIVRREFAAYLRTPSGYVIAAVILLWEGLAFNAYAVGSDARLSTEVLQRFLEIAGGTTIVAAVLFSMRLMAEERANGTMTLLFTSPVRESEIVIGKYLASLTVLSVVILLSLYLPALIFVNGKVSVGHIASGYLGMLLLGASTLAMGAFASTLVTHPFVAVLLTGALAAMLNLTWWVGRITDPPLSALISSFSPYYDHFQPFRKGLLELSSTVFFLSLIYVSLFAAIRVLQSQRWR